MEATLEDIRRHFSLLSDEALLDTRREDLTDTAKTCYDAELAARRLKQETTAAGPSESPAGAEDSSDNLVEVATFEHAEEVRIAQALLKSAGIPSHRSDERVHKANQIFGEVKLLVPAELADEARLVLESQISDEELAAQAEAAAAVDEEPANDD
jgi:hypothetical protein